MLYYLEIRIISYISYYYMNRISTLKIFLFVILSVFYVSLKGQINGFEEIKWETEKIAPGLTWKSTHTVLNDSVPQNINVLIINTNRRIISLSYDPDKNICVSKQAEKATAIAAVNAGFFNIKEGGSGTYLKTGGVIVDTDTAKKWRRNANMTGSVLIDKNGHVTLSVSKTNSWYDSHPEYTEVLVTGPLLLSGKIQQVLPVTPLVVNKHPRTAIGKKGNHKVVLITLDGRTDQAKGMTLSELTDLMISLHCKDAVNLDGGGSTTMWINGKPFNGVVNMPCDNKKFDHEGERAVSDILIIR
jgi:exopolysaccharide biosynthesis protein